jgi:transposase
MWYAGIDWADEHHDAVVIDEAGKRVVSLRVAHSAEGLAQLQTTLRGIGDVGAHPEHLACIVETSHGLLISSLLEAGLAVYPVNPKTVDRHRKPSGAKTDAIDAYLLARTGRSDLADLRRLTPDSPVIAELKVLTRDQDSLIQSQTRLVNQLTACLKAYYPAALPLFGKLQQPSTLAFLAAFPTLAQARAATVADLASVLTAAAYPGAAAKARTIQERVHGPHLEADPVLTRAKARLMVSLVAQLQVLLPQIAAYDAEITRLFLSHADSAAFASLPRAGERLAPRLLAEWGDDRGRYGAAANVQALAGTAPVAIESGKFRTVRRRHACLKPLRNTLYQFAWQSTQAEAWSLAYYQRKRQEGKSHSVALRALANHWVRIIYALWSKHQTYDAGVFLAAQQAHAPRAACYARFPAASRQVGTPSTRGWTREGLAPPSSGTHRPPSPVVAGGERSRRGGSGVDPPGGPRCSAGGRRGVVGCPAPSTPIRHPGSVAGLGTSATSTLRRDRSARTAPSPSGGTRMAVSESCRAHSARDASVVQRLQATDTGEQRRLQHVVGGHGLGGGSPRERGDQ